MLRRLVTATCILCKWRRTSFTMITSSVTVPLCGSFQFVRWRYLYLYQPWDKRWSIYKWLLDRGADSTWIHPVLLTTPGHNLASQTVEMITALDPCAALEVTKCFLTSSQRDNCMYLYSHGAQGCHAIASTVARLSFTAPYLDWSCWLLNERRVQKYLFTLIDEYRNAEWMSSALIRVMIFEELSLTHTCCY